jgi:hypothetical protein
MKKSESDYQIEVFAWARNPPVLKKYPDLAVMFCTGNGLKLSIGQATKFKRQGNLKGVHDIILLVPKKHYGGLLIEMKTEKGVISKEQKWFHKEMTDRNFLSVVCYSSTEAINCIEEYLK